MKSGRWARKGQPSTVSRWPNSRPTPTSRNGSGSVPRSSCDERDDSVAVSRVVLDVHHGAGDIEALFGERRIESERIETNCQVAPRSALGDLTVIVVARSEE